MIKPTERRQGHSKLVYNKATRTIDTVDPHPTAPSEGEAMRGTYLEMMRAHVDEGGQLSHRNGLDLLAEVERLRAAASRTNAPLVIDPADRESPP